MREAILLKPLDGKPEGTKVEFSNIDFDELVKLGAVKAAPTAVPVPEPVQKSEPAPENKAERAPLNKSAAKPK